MIAFIVSIALLLDYLLGEPKRWHPLVGFGRLAVWVERHFWQVERSPVRARLRGGLALILLLMPPILIVALLAQFVVIDYFISAVLLYLAIGGRSLVRHAMQVHDALIENDTVKAQTLTGLLVSRDTNTLNEEQLAKATVESVLENGCDAVFGAIFWFILAGAPGVVFYRLANTLDAMWGYRTERYLYFGWAAARLDDVLNFIPAHLTALTYAVVGEFHNALRCWRRQAYSWKSPNAGPVMAAGAGALSVQLGGAASYQGEWQQRPLLGLNKKPAASDIKRALNLVVRGMLLWWGVIMFGAWFFA